MRGLLVLAASFTFLFACAFVAIFPPLLLVLIPLYGFGAFKIFYKPRPKPATFESWWDENWKDFL